MRRGDDGARRDAQRDLNSLQRAMDEETAANRTLRKLRQHCWHHLILQSGHRQGLRRSLFLDPVVIVFLKVHDLPQGAKFTNNYINFSYHLKLQKKKKDRNENNEKIRNP